MGYTLDEKQQALTKVVLKSKNSIIITIFINIIIIIIVSVVVPKFKVSGLYQDLSNGKKCANRFTTLY